MNAENERNRESSSHSTDISPNHPARFFSSSAGCSSKLNSPLIAPSKTFPDFNQHDSLSFGNLQQQRRTSLITPPNYSPKDNNVAQQDDNYHLYHEPDLPDEEPSPTSLISIGPHSMRVNTPKSSEHHISHSPALPNVRLSKTVIAPNSCNNIINANNTSPGAREKSFVGPDTPTSINSPTINNNNENNGNQRSLVSASSFADRTGSSRRNDVSADIYFCYVSLKSTERANHRSRSYHGPKNTNEPSQTHQLPYAKDAHKNLSSISIAESPLSPAAFATMIPVHFRDHCVRELIETESNYVHALDMILTCFAKPLEPLLKREENQLIFGHIKHFHHIHSNFQADLVKAAMRSYNNASPLSSPTAQNQVPVSPPLSATCKNGNSLKISSCFLNIKEKFLKYGEYCATLSRAQALLDELTNKSETIAAQLDRCQHDANEGKFKLRDLLSLPMQRILKYHLLLAQLIKNTSSSNEDYNGLKRAHDAMVDLGQYINEVKRDTEAIQIINDIEQSIIGLNMPPNTQLTDYGRLVIDGSIRIRVPHETKSKLANDSKIKLPHDTKLKQKRYVFVFDKVLLMCKEGVRGYQYKEALVLSEFDIDRGSILAPGETLSKHATKDKWSHNFNLVRSSDMTTYSFYTKTLEMKSRWIESIQKAKDNIRPAACRNNETNHEFLMHTFDKASSCDHCGKLLLGLYYQGYRCRTCFTSAHKKCLSSIRPCGPTLPPRSNNTIMLSRGRCKEPPSPSVKSQCSDDGHNMFIQFPPSNSSSTQCVDVIAKNEYSNIDNRLEANLIPSSSFRDNGTRPVSSMINVSLQNTTNHFIQHERFLKGSNSMNMIENTDLTNGHPSGKSYVNFILNGYPWFRGRMERDQAQALLENAAHETFLVRVSPKHNGSYVISLNYNNQVKHMRIYVSRDNQLYLSQNRYFKSVIELVAWYEQNSLKESFHMLDAKLAIPFASD